MAQDTEHVLSHRWKRLWRGHPRAHKAYLALTRCYVDNALPYHNLDLIVKHLSLLDNAGFLANDPRSVELALWYHRVVCDASRDDNEAASASFAVQEMTKLGVHVHISSRVARLILAIRFDHQPQDDDEGLMIDILRSVLGAGAEDYAQYSRHIREEFPHLSDAEYVLARLDALDRILRSGIYRSPHFRAKFGERARRNMASERVILLTQA